MKNSLLILVLILFGCESNPLGMSDNWPEGDIDIVLDPRLEQDENGYYHMELSDESWQTLHRISGTAYVDGEPLESFPVHWESSHYWLIGDTLGYIINQGLTDDLVYVSYDTTYVTCLKDLKLIQSIVQVIVMELVKLIQCLHLFRV